MSFWRKMICLVVLLSFSTIVSAEIGPIAPTKETVSKTSSTSIDPTTLPYQPKEVSEDGTVIEPTTPADSSTVDTSITNPSDPNSLGSTSVGIDWTKMPYISSKPPELKPATDPTLQP